MKTKDSPDDADETLPFPESLLDERWEGGPPVASIRAAQAAEPEDREAAPGAPSESAETEPAEADTAATPGRLIDQIAAFVESRTSDPAEGERLARDLRSAFAIPSEPDGGESGRG